MVSVDKYLSNSKGFFNGCTYYLSDLFGIVIFIVIVIFSKVWSQIILDYLYSHNVSKATIAFVCTIIILLSVCYLDIEFLRKKN